MIPKSEVLCGCHLKSSTPSVALSSVFMLQGFVPHWGLKHMRRHQGRVDVIQCQRGRENVTKKSQIYSKRVSLLGFILSPRPGSISMLQQGQGEAHMSAFPRKPTFCTFHLWLLPLSVWHAAYDGQVALRVACVTLVADYRVGGVALTAAAHRPPVLHLRRSSAHG